MTFLAIVATVIALIVSVLVLVYSENGTGHATVYVFWIVAGVLWLAVVVG